MEMLGEEGYEAARATTLNAHFTDPAIAAPMWNAMSELGFEHGTVLEPGSGMGTFIGLAPQGARMTGVELDPTTAELASHLYPQASIRAEGFETTRFPRRDLRRGDRQRPLRQLQALRQDPQRRRALHPQPLHHQVSGPRPPRWRRSLHHQRIHPRLAEPRRP